MTGGNPGSTGIHDDVEYSHSPDEPGVPCAPGRPARGGDVVRDSPDDALANPHQLSGVQVEGMQVLPGVIARPGR